MSVVSTIEFVLRPGGEIVRRDMSEYPVAVPDKLLEAINKDVSIPLHALLNIDDWGWMGMMVTGGKVHYVTVQAKRIILRTAFDLIDKKEKILVPNFASSDPQMELAWTPPPDMGIVILMTIQQHKDADYSIPKCFLYAMDERPQYWRLPLSNIYDDCGICEGRAIGRFPTMMAAVMDMLTTFDRSRWNRDLWGNDVKERTQTMFRFQDQGEGKVIALPPGEKKWTKLCEKVATDVQKYIVL